MQFAWRWGDNCEEVKYRGRKTLSGKCFAKPKVQKAG